ncbi:heterokaryon incompatibility protein-domain-containing protein [Boeremia exigua]|uniref:heterokaryon incompatibility protein-domain-containing protein n=1 Tax=Boeremia exigua TaxID=749465 RepID=UPI001E8E9B5E|nr:heterokaryon incompatibility protein-domain-containing protein [Boeremia exigua]KAH6616359.1 heterokaryon incompatibility protein-domain-containing protein [Boeremia exigua]
MPGRTTVCPNNLSVTQDGCYEFVFVFRGSSIPAISRCHKRNPFTSSPWQAKEPSGRKNEVQPQSRILERAEPFEALSYEWGAATNQQIILLDGRPFAVISNPHVALTHLRRESETRCLWVDALCINQADHHERSSQVAHMQHIYRLAKTSFFLVIHGQGVMQSRT